MRKRLRIDHREDFNMNINTDVLFRVKDLGVIYSDLNQMYELVCYKDTTLKKGTSRILSNGERKLIEDDTPVETCYVLAFFEQNHKEPDVNIRFVGNRVFEYENQELVYKMLKSGYDMIYTITDLESELK